MNTTIPETIWAQIVCANLTDLPWLYSEEVDIAHVELEQDIELLATASWGIRVRTYRSSYFCEDRASVLRFLGREQVKLLKAHDDLGVAMARLETYSAQ